MATFTATAESTETIGYANYGASTWNTGTANGASQGAYQSTAASNSRVGVMVFSGAGAALKNAAISQITLKITCSAAGASGNTKVLTFRKAKYQTLTTTVLGSAQVGDVLGTLTGTFYGNTVTHTLNASTNSALFVQLVAYLKDGNSALVLYNGETSTSTSYSTNYARVTSCTLTVTYAFGTVWYRNGNAWQECLVYYRNGAGWVQCVPYYRSGGTWVQV